MRITTRICIPGLRKDIGEDLNSPARMLVTAAFESNCITEPGWLAKLRLPENQVVWMWRIALPLLWSLWMWRVGEGYKYLFFII